MAASAELINQETDYIFVDSLPDVALARYDERQEAEQLLESRRQAFLAGEVALTPPIDALSTARAVLNARDETERQELYEGHLQDSRRLVAEWYRKNTAEAFAPLRQPYDPVSEQFFSHGLSIRQMTENALLPIPKSPEEELRRVNERVEDATPLIVRKALGGLAVERAVRTISECTDQAIEEYQYDIANKQPHRGYGGYVPEIEKLMIRDIRFREGTDDRFEEQVGLPGTYINHFVIKLALEQRGLAPGDMDKTLLHGSQILAGDNLMEFVALLDKVASEQWCTNIFMGEPVEADHEKDYVAFAREAQERQLALEDNARTVANFVLDLAHDNVDRTKALIMIEEFVKRLLLNVAKDNLDLAEQMFDRQTADGLREVAYLESIGQYDEAFNKMGEVEKAAPGGGYCGAGSCGLEAVNTRSETGQKLAQKLSAQAGDKIVSDKVRVCKCGSRSIVYAYNANKVNKYCASCERRESKSGSVLAKR